MSGYRYDINPGMSARHPEHGTATVLALSADGKRVFLDVDGATLPARFDLDTDHGWTFGPGGAR